MNNPCDGYCDVCSKRQAEQRLVVSKLPPHILTSYRVYPGSHREAKRAQKPDRAAVALIDPGKTANMLLFRDRIDFHSTCAHSSAG